MQISLWGLFGVLFSYANRYLVGVGLSDTAAEVAVGLATALGFSCSRC